MKSHSSRAADLASPACTLRIFPARPSDSLRMRVNIVLAAGLKKRVHNLLLLTFVNTGTMIACSIGAPPALVQAHPLASVLEMECSFCSVGWNFGWVQVTMML